MRRKLFGLLALFAVLVALDLQRAPSGQLTARATITAIHAYQASLSRVYERMGVRCRFTPTCSHYGEICIRQFGLVRGGLMAAGRVIRCGPWTPMGTVDEPPSLGA